MFRLRIFKDAKHFFLRSLLLKKKLSTDEESLDLSSAIFNMGTVCLKLNETDDALVYLEKAKQIHSKIDSDSLQAAEVCSQLGSLYVQLKQYDEAMREIYTAFSIRTKKLDSSNEDICATCHHIANVCYQQEMFDKAHLFYSFALDNAVSVELQGHIFHGLGNTYTKINDDEKAVEMYQKALELKRRHQPISSSVAKTCRNLAILLKNSDSKQALKLIDEAIKITKSVYIFPTSVSAKLFIDKSKLLTSDKEESRKSLIEAEKVLMIANFKDAELRPLQKELNRAWRKVGGRPDDIDQLVVGLE